MTSGLRFGITVPHPHLSSQIHSPPSLSLSPLFLSRARRAARCLGPPSRPQPAARQGRRLVGHHQGLPAYHSIYAQKLPDEISNLKKQPLSHRAENLF